MLHGRITLGEVHKFHNWEFATAALRAAAEGLQATDIGKVAWQLDEDTFWVLKDNFPITWVPIDADSAQTLETATTAGVVVLPSHTNNGDGTVTIGAGRYALYDNPNYIGTANVYDIAGATFTLADNSPTYIVAAYNSGSPTIAAITSIPPANLTDSDYIPVFTCYRAGNDIHHFDWDHLSRGLAEKLNQRLRRTDRFHIDNGLGLTETPTRVINVAAGQVWAGANLISMNAITSASPEVHFYYHTASAWTRGTLSQYNNTQYDDGTNLVALTNGRYAVNWIYRSVQEEGAIYVILGRGNYSLIEAQASSEPVKPAEISTQAVLIGRIIVLKDAATSTQIDTITTTTFTSSGIVNHNDLSSIQGGSTNNYYHATATEYSALQTLSTGATKASTRLITSSGNILLTDSTIRADATTAAITLSLPAAASCTGYIFKIKKINQNQNSVVIDANLSELIDGSSEAAINITNQSLTLQSNGTSWDIL